MTAAFSIAGRPIGPGKPVYVIAELSANHRQHEDVAVELVHAAKAAGADAVKLQTYTPDTITIDSDAPSFRAGSGSLWEGTTLHGLYEEAYMPWDWQPRLKELKGRLRSKACPMPGRARFGAASARGPGETPSPAMGPAINTQ